MKNFINKLNTSDHLALRASIKLKREKMLIQSELGAKLAY